MRKTILCTISILLIAVNASAQKDAEHILFKGIPITGIEEDFSNQLATKGFMANKGFLTGPFAGYYTTLHLKKTTVSGMIYSVTAQLHPCGWKQAKADYIIFKTNMSLKYGQPTSVSERFSGAFHEGDGYELKALSEDACRFCSEWKTSLGRITIEIHYIDKAAAVTITYEDATNAKLNIQEKTNIFLEDL